MASVLNAETVVFPVPLIPKEWNMADVRAHVGDVPLERIRTFPPPGMATEEDALKKPVCELIDGILVEKAMGVYESVLALLLATEINNYLATNPIGFISGEQGPYRLLPRRMRVPDMAFVRWDRLPGRKFPRGQVLTVAPDLVVEILSPSNTRKEMDDKLKEYFKAGVRLVWYVDPEKRTAEVYTSPADFEQLDADGILDGRDVLPGFKLKFRTGSTKCRGKRGRDGNSDRPSSLFRGFGPFGDRIPSGKPHATRADRRTSVRGGDHPFCRRYVHEPPRRSLVMGASRTLLIRRL
jgi:Uma2 family endonuclease